MKSPEEILYLKNAELCVPIHFSVSNIYQVLLIMCVSDWFSKCMAISRHILYQQVWLFGTPVEQLCDIRNSTPSSVQPVDPSPRGV
jgi:hypothetical protein